MNGEPDVQAAAAFHELNSARALLQLNRPHEAMRRLTAAASMDPGSADVQTLLGVTWLQLGDVDEALQALERAISLAPADPWPHQVRAHALLRRHRPTEAVAAAREAVRLAPGDVRSHTALAEAQAHRFMLRAAAKAATTARELAPNDPDTHVLLADIAARSFRWARVESHARDALAIDAENQPALSRLGRALWHMGFVREGTTCIAMAARLDPRNSFYSNQAFQASMGWFAYGAMGFLALLLGLSNDMDGLLAFGLAGVGTVALLLARRTLARLGRQRPDEASWRTPIPQATRREMREFRREAIHQSRVRLPKGKRRIRMILVAINLPIALLCFGVVVAPPWRTRDKREAALLVIGLFAAGLVLVIREVILRRRDRSRIRARAREAPR